LFAGSRLAAHHTTCVQVQDGAAGVFGPILERSAKAERIRSVQLLLKRFSGLFSAPQRVTALGAARDYEQVSISMHTGSSTHPSVFLYISGTQTTPWVAFHPCL
jgi:hypothetical protein